MYLLDTNVISELRRLRAGKANENVSAWIHSVPDEQNFVSVITIHELEVGVQRAEHRDPAQGLILRTWLMDGVLPAFAGRVLTIDTDVALASARFHVPNPQAFHDGFIAATALVHNMVVVTRNVADFARTGVRLLNPWEPQA